MDDPIITGILQRLASLEKPKAVVPLTITTASQLLVTWDTLLTIPLEPNVVMSDYITIDPTTNIAAFKNGNPNLYRVMKQLGRVTTKTIRQENPDLTFNHLVAALLYKRLAPPAG